MGVPLFPTPQLLKPNEEENKEVEGVRGGNSGTGLGQVLVALNVLTWALQPLACVSVRKESMACQASLPGQLSIKVT